jgi:hypothetical protein
VPRHHISISYLLFPSKLKMKLTSARLASIATMNIVSARAEPEFKYREHWIK